MAKKQVQQVVKQVYQTKRSVDGHIPIRTLPLTDALARLKGGLGSVAVPELKKLEIRYYRNNSPPGVKTFIAQHAPELAYANPNLPFTITRLGKPLDKPTGESERARKEALEAAAAGGSSSSGSTSQPPAPTAAPVEETSTDIPAESNAEASESTQQSYTEALKSYTSPSDKPTHLMEDGKTTLRKGDTVPAELVFDFHTKPTQKLVAAQNATEILAQILRAANVEVPAEIEGPKRPQAIPAPESL